MPQIDRNDELINLPVDCDHILDYEVDPTNNSRVCVYCLICDVWAWYRTEGKYDERGRLLYTGDDN